MQSKEFIIERASAIVFHYTNIKSALAIITTGQFQLSSTYGSIEQGYAKKDAPYFLSTTRTLRGGYHNTVGYSAAMFNLDGNYFNQKYKAGPMDYWGDRHNNYGRQSEAEDRIFSQTPTIPIGSSVLSLHVYAKPMTEKDRSNWGDWIPSTIRKLLIAAKTNGIKTYLYVDEEAWRLQDKRKVVPISKSLEVLNGPNQTGRTYQSHSYIEPWLELIFKNKKEDLTERADKLRYRLVYAYSQSDQGLGNDLSGARKPGAGDREHAVKLIALMKQNNWKTPVDVATAMGIKWKAIK